VLAPSENDNCDGVDVDVPGAYTHVCDFKCLLEAMSNKCVSNNDVCAYGIIAHLFGTVVHVNSKNETSFTCVSLNFHLAAVVVVHPSS
jgi:hypothetical protein